jgi:NADH-quinone oxidoreductase subunit M
MENWKWGAWAVPGVVLAAAYLLWLYQRVFFGTVTNPKNEKLQDLTPREVATFVPLLIMAFWIGLYPKPFFQILEQPVNHTISMVRPDYPLPAATVGASIPAAAYGTTYYTPTASSSVPGDAAAPVASDAAAKAPAAAPKMKGNN